MRCIKEQIPAIQHGCRTGAELQMVCISLTKPKDENLEVIQTWFNSGSGMEAGVSHLDIA
jgi:hypothetical protein